MMPATKPTMMIQMKLDTTTSLAVINATIGSPGEYHSALKLRP